MASAKRIRAISGATGSIAIEISHWHSQRPERQACRDAAFPAGLERECDEGRAVSGNDSGSSDSVRGARRELVRSRPPKKRAGENFWRRRHSPLLSTVEAARHFVAGSTAPDRRSKPALAFPRGKHVSAIISPPRWAWVRFVTQAVFFSSAQNSRKSSKVLDSTAQRSARILLAPATLQNIPDFFSYSQITLRQAPSITPDPTGRARPPQPTARGAARGCGRSDRHAKVLQRPGRAGAQRTRRRNPLLAIRFRWRVGRIRARLAAPRGKGE